MFFFFFFSILKKGAEKTVGTQFYSSYLIKSHKHCIFAIIPQTSFTPDDLAEVIFQGEYYH